MIPHSRPWIQEADEEAVLATLRSGMIGSGKLVGEFERKIAEYIGREQGHAFNSGTTALAIALEVLEAENQEVILPAYACGSLLNACAQARVKPVLADVAEEHWNLSATAVKKAITPKTRAIIAPYMLGDDNPEMDEILRMGLPVIEDLAQAFGLPAGRGAASVCSFYATKMLPAGQGGMVLSDDAWLNKKTRSVYEHGDREEWVPAYNFAMSELHAALGLSQLAQFEQSLEKRKRIANIYDSVLETPLSRPNSVMFRYVVSTDSVPAYIERMKNEGVACARPVYKPLHHYLGGKMPNTDYWHEKLVSVPVHPSLTYEEVKHICHVLQK